MLGIAPHIIRPLEFVLPAVKGLRPDWMIRMGLFLYDHLDGSWARFFGGRKRRLNVSRAVDLKAAPYAGPLQEGYTRGYAYADCWVDDARLVALNAAEARSMGADILTHTACVKMEAMADGEGWTVTLRSMISGEEFQVTAAKIVNTAGPWVRSVLEASDLAADAPEVRLVKGSHIIVPRLHDGPQAYILQQPDRRIVFAIPYEEKFTLIGTTDQAFEGDASMPVISEEEKDYLCAAANRFFETQIGHEHIVWTYSGVRALFDDGDSSNSKVTRDYKFHLDTSKGAPILSMFGGKITTYRMLAEHALDRLDVKGARWTGKRPLPGGDIDGGDFATFFEAQKALYPFLPEAVLYRCARAYGTRVAEIFGSAQTMRDLGRDFGGGLYEAEVRYLKEREFARTAQDILWRRTKLGLHLDHNGITALENFMQGTV